MEENNFNTKNNTELDNQISNEEKLSRKIFLNNDKKIEYLCNLIQAVERDFESSELNKKLIKQQSKM